MKHALAVIAALATVLGACGGMDTTEATAEALGQQSSALVSCSTMCSSGPLSCTGTTCSAADGDHVQCDGAYQFCPTTNPTSCTATASCRELIGTACAQTNVWRECCLDAQTTSNCVCTYQHDWTCDMPAEG
ncbi:hypothetical protein G4177_09580 [Corallococcus sp. ZKHCc1 1396]|uniref:Lipoprotein n=1 Tax=Corallococcus soli TaxID=2710757 RepID=A0ABR9PKI4_9BACT|nr:MULTISPECIES: hypothetical protein [Corallococcus]MBE4748415.1 hypothetical protein [Corallococcus soli]MCY1034799.1 hypothetical protein [Corallococcus sp. BB11-1]RYZ17344.1 MAG: hypothetical protein EOO70_02220 [Myxococcaceae bacterium]